MKKLSIYILILFLFMFSVKGYNLTNFTYDLSKSNVNTYMDFDDVIRDYCDQWRNYSTNSYKFLFSSSWFLMVLGVIGNFFNPKILIYKPKPLKNIIIKNEKIKNFIQNNYLKFFTIEIKPIKDLYDITLFVIIYRILSIYLIIEAVIK